MIYKPVVRAQHRHKWLPVKRCLAGMLKDREVMNARLKSEEVGCGIMAQSQEIFDCCRGNPLLLFPLPEGDNGFALLPSCTCRGGDKNAGTVSRQKAFAKKDAIVWH